MKAALFDFNGTLFYDTDKHKEAWKSYGGILMGREVTEEEFQTYMLGRNNELILTFLLQRSPTPSETYEMGNAKEACYRRLCKADPDTLHLAPGAEEYLDYLKQSGIPCNIATSSNRENLDFYFEAFRLERWFDKELCVCDNADIAGKPAPDIYLLAAEKIGVSAADCTIFEDAISGIRAAYNANACEIIAVASSASLELLAKQNGVSKVIRDYRELL